MHSFGNIAELEAGIWAKVLAGCSLGQGEAAVGMTSMVAVWQCGQVSAAWCLGHSLALSWCQHGASPVSGLVTATLSSPCQGREAQTPDDIGTNFHLHLYNSYLELPDQI